MISRVVYAVWYFVYGVFLILRPPWGMTCHTMCRVQSVMVLAWHWHDIGMVDGTEEHLGAEAAEVSFDSQTKIPRTHTTGFRLFVIAPSSWKLLRTASGWILDDIQKPTKEVCALLVHVWMRAGQCVRVGVSVCGRAGGRARLQVCNRVRASVLDTQSPGPCIQWLAVSRHSCMTLQCACSIYPRRKGLFSWEQEPKKSEEVDTVLDALYGKNSEKGQMDRLLYMLAGTLVFEFALETVPQLMVQGLNNSARDSWTAFTILSFAISLGVGLDTVYRIGTRSLCPDVSLTFAI